MEYYYQSQIQRKGMNPWKIVPGSILLVLGMLGMILSILGNPTNFSPSNFCIFMACLAMMGAGVGSTLFNLFMGTIKGGQVA